MQLCLQRVLYYTVNQKIKSIELNSETDKILYDKKRTSQPSTIWLLLDIKFYHDILFINCKIKPYLAELQKIFHNFSKNFQSFYKCSNVKRFQKNKVQILVEEGLRLFKKLFGLKIENKPLNLYQVLNMIMIYDYQRSYTTVEKLLNSTFQVFFRSLFPKVNIFV